SRFPGECSQLGLLRTTLGPRSRETGPKGFEPLTYRSLSIRTCSRVAKSRSLYLTKLRAQCRSKRGPINERIVRLHGGGQKPTIAAAGTYHKRSASAPL